MFNQGEQIDNNLIIESCGEGSYATVYKVQDAINLNFFALKLCKGAETEDVDRFRDENQILHSLKPHKNIINPLSFIVDTDPTRIYYTMELADCNLDRLLISTDTTDEEKIKIFSEICDGLKHAHSNKIIHRDLHWENILIVGGSEVKINDFGKAKEFVINRKANSIKPCWGWFVSPPEFRFNIFDQSSEIKYFIPGDIYALGIILYYLFENPPLDYITGLNRNIEGFLLKNGIKLEDTNITERNKLYKKWLEISTPSKNLIVSSIKNDNVNKNVNEIIKKATVLDFNLRYQDIDQLMTDVGNIFV